MFLDARKKPSLEKEFVISDFGWNLINERICLASQAQHFSVSNFFPEHTRFSFFNFLCLAQHVRRNKLLQTSAVNQSLQSLLRNNSHSCLFSIRIQSNNLLLLLLYKVNEDAFPFIRSCQYQRKLLNNAREFQISLISVLWDNETYWDWSVLINSRFDKVYLVELIADVAQTPNFLLFSACVFSIYLYLVTEWWPIRNLIAIQALFASNFIVSATTL